MARSEPPLAPRLRRAGFSSPDRAESFLTEINQRLGDRIDTHDQRWVRAMSRSGNPDAAALGFVRFVESLGQAPEQLDTFVAALGRDASSNGSPDGPLNEPLLERLVTVFGASDALTDHLVRHPASWARVDVDGPHVLIGTPFARAQELRAALLRAVGADPDADVPVADIRGADGVAAMRHCYRDLVLALAVDDLTAPAPREIVGEVSRILSWLAGGALDAGLAVARADVEGAERVRLAIIGMGKCGAQELNYVSDVDVVYVWAPAGAAGEESTSELSRIAARLANGAADACAAPAAESALWEVDAALRPEGKAGPLVRTLEEFRSYYEKWAENWEFQALLKGTPIAGDAALGREWFEALNPLVWQASAREGFVDQVRAMRARVTGLIPRQEAARQLKLGAGGLRDVEFSAQLLQLVHGRVDESLRVPGTLQALEALRDGGYMGRKDAEILGEAYRFMRVIEHRLQLPRLSRTHLIPTSDAALRTLARLVFPPNSGTERSVAQLESERERQSKDVRTMHERIFYRPVLAAVARLSDDEARLTPENAEDRLMAFGYRDPEGALVHLRALTKGVSRSAAIQKQLLPVILHWLSRGVDPDTGLLAFRSLSENLGDSGWYLRMLRDSSGAAERVTTLLSGSGFVTGLLERRPAATAWLDHATDLEPRPRSMLATEATGLAHRHRGRPSQVLAIRSAYSREVLRTAMSDVLQLSHPEEVPGVLSAIMEVAIDGAAAAIRERLFSEAEESGTVLPECRFAVIAMGRLGGAEIGYFSDADVMFVYDLGRMPDGSAPDDETRATVATLMRRLAMALTQELGAADKEQSIELDADLRPEGKAGPLVRTLDSYRTYYAKWSEPWEAQALLRARFIAGDPSLGVQCHRLFDGLRYPAAMPASSVRQVRRLKARMEEERLPKAADPKRHLKLGRGGLSDVEWTAQLLQLQHAHKNPSLQTTSTLEALRAAPALGLMTPEDSKALIDAWVFTTRLRSAAMLWRGRTAESLPTDRRDLEGISRLLGYPEGSAADVETDYLRLARRARRVHERIFYDD